MTSVVDLILSLLISVMWVITAGFFAVVILVWVLYMMYSLGRAVGDLLRKTSDAGEGDAASGNSATASSVKDRDVGDMNAGAPGACDVQGAMREPGVVRQSPDWVVASSGARKYVRSVGGEKAAPWSGSEEQRIDPLMQIATAMFDSTFIFHRNNTTQNKHDASAKQCDCSCCQEIRRASYEKAELSTRGYAAAGLLGIAGVAGIFSAVPIIMVMRMGALGVFMGSVGIISMCSLVWGIVEPVFLTREQYRIRWVSRELELKYGKVQRRSQNGSSADSCSSSCSSCSSCGGCGD